MFTSITDDTYKKHIISHGFTVARVAIATVTFGMGINCPDVSQVIHLRSPCSLLNYARESGRSGRDERQAVAKLYYCLGSILQSLTGKQQSTNRKSVIF